MKVIIRLAVVILLVCGIGCGEKKEKKSLSDFPEKAHFRGIVKGREIDVPAQRSGYLKRILCQEGDEISLNQLLFILNQGEIFKELELARALLSKSRKEIEYLLAGYREEDIEAQQKEVKKASVDFAYNQEDYKRSEALVRKGIIPKQRFDQVSRALFISQAELGRAESVLKKLKRGHTLAEIAVAEAEVVARRATVSIWKERLSQTIATSSIKGAVLARNYEIGEWVIEGTSVLTIVDLRDVWVEIYILQTQLGKVVIGQKAEVEIDAFPGEVFEGKVVFIADKYETPAEIYQTKGEHTQSLFRVKIKIFNPEEKVRPGMTIAATFRKEVG